MKEPRKKTAKDIFSDYQQEYVKSTSGTKDNLNDNLKLKSASDIFNPNEKEIKDYLGETSPSPVLGGGQSTRVDFGEEGFNERLGKNMRPDINPNDAYYENQGKIETAGKFLGNVASGAILKASQGFSILGSAIGETALAGLDLGLEKIGEVAGTQAAWLLGKSPEEGKKMGGMLLGGLLEKAGYDGQFDLEDITNNPINDIFFKSEEWMKENLGKVYTPSNWNDKSFFEQVKDGTWWANEGADGIAFALSNFVPAGFLGKIGAGGKLLNGLADIAESNGITRFLTANRAGLLRGVAIGEKADRAVSTAFMTSSESLFEAKDTGETITRMYLDNYNKAKGTQYQTQEELEQADPQAVEELKAKKGDAMKHTFWANMAALSASNWVEAGLLSKMMGKGNAGILASEIQAGKFGDDIVKIQRKGLNKFFNGTLGGTTLKTIGKQMVTEGLYEENIQHAIQNVSQNLSLNGKIDTLKFIEEVGKESITNLGDKEAWKSIGAGMIIGGMFGGVGNLGIPGISKGEFKEKQEQISEGINTLNSLSNNLRNAGQIYNEKGEIDTPKLQNLVANLIQQKNISAIHDYYKGKGENEIADIVKNEAVANYVKGFMEAGLEEDLKMRMKELSTQKIGDDNLKGYDPIEIKNGQEITIGNRFKDINDKVEDYIKQYKVLNKIIPEVERARTGEALSWYARYKQLEGLEKGLHSDLFSQGVDTTLGNNKEGVHSVINTINELSKKHKRLTAELPNQERFSLPIRSENTRKELALIEKEIETLKLNNIEDLEKEGKVITNGVEPLEQDESPEFKSRELIERTLTQVKNAKQDAIDNYRGLTDKEGGKAFYESLASKIEEESKTENVTDDNSLEEGDYINVTNDKNQKAAGFISRNENGDLVFGNTKVDEEFLKNKIVKLTSEEVSQLKNRRISNLQKSEIRQKITALEEFIKKTNERKEKGEKYLLEKLIEKEELILNVEKGTVRLTERQLAKELKKIERIIEEAEDLLKALEVDNQINKNTITELKYAHDNPETIEEVEALIKLKEEEIKEVEEKISIVQPLFDKIKSLYYSMLNAWKSLFPKTEYIGREKYIDTLNQLQEQLTNGEISEEAYDAERDAIQQAVGNLSDYTDYKQDLQLTGAEMRTIQRDLEELKDTRERLYNELQEYEGKLAKYELEVAKLEYTKPLIADSAQKETSVNIPAQSKKDGSVFNDKKSKDISNALNTTAGRHVDNNGNLTEDTSQLRWFKFAEEYDPTTKKARLRTVTIDDAEYGTGRKEIGKDKIAEIERRRQEDLQKGQLFLMNDGTYGGSRLVPLEEYSAIQIQENNLDSDVTKWDYNTFNGTGIFVNLSLGVAYIVPNNSYNGKKAEVVKVFINKTTKRFDLSNPRIINTPNIELVAKAANIDSKELYNEVLNAITKYDAELKVLPKEKNPNNIFANDPIEYQNDKHIKVLVVDEKGNPIKRDGQFIFTSLVEERETYDSFTNAKGKTEAEITKLKSDYSNFLAKAKKAPQFLAITRRSNGFAFRGSPINIKEAFGTEEIQLKLVTTPLNTVSNKLNDNLVPDSTNFPLIKGLVYAIFNGRPVGLLLRKVNQNERDALIERLKEYAKVRGTKDTTINAKSILNQILSTIFLGQRIENNQFSTYFLKGEDKFVFGENIIDIKDLIEGKYDVQLDEHLSNLNHHVDRKQLESKTEYRDVFGKVWKSYKEYLVSERPDAPLMTDLKPLSNSINEPQFAGTYLEYSTGQKREVVKKDAGKKTTASNKAASKVSGKEDFAADLDFIKTADIEGLDSLNIPEVSSIDIKNDKGLDEKVNNIKDAQTFSSLFDEEENTKEAEQVTKPDNKISVHGQKIDASELAEIISNRPTLQDIIDEEKEENEESSNDISISDIGSDDLFGLDFDASRVKEDDNSQVNFEEEKAWFRKNISSTIAFEKIKGLINGKALGHFTSNGEVLISDAATAGVGYHEAFHVVSNLYLSEKEQHELHQEWLNKNKDRLEDLRKQDIYIGKSDNFIAEEELAEEFREYMLTNESEYKSWFSKIVDFIKGLIGLDNNKKDLLFSKIKQGSFLDTEVYRRSNINLYSTSKILGVTLKKELMDGLSVILFQNLYATGFDVKDIRDFNKYIQGTEKEKQFANLYKESYGILLRDIKNNPNKMVSSTLSKEDFIKELQRPEMKEAIQDMHLKSMLQFGIKFGLEEETELNNLPEGDRGRDTLGIVDSIEFSTKNGMPNQIKLLIASLPQMYQDGTKVNKEGKEVPNIKIKRSKIGLPMLTDYRRNVSILHNSLARLESFEDMIETVKKLSIKIPEFSFLARKLDTKEATTRAGAYIQSQFRQQFDKNNYTFFMQLYDLEKKNSVIINANSSRMADLIKAKWQGQLKKNTTSTKIVNGEQILNEKYFAKKYETLGESVRETVLSFYKDLGITFSNPNEVDIDVLTDKMSKLLEVINEGEVSVNIINQEGIKGWINSVVEQEVKTSLDYSDNQHISPSGKTVYNISLNDYLSLSANDMNKGKKDMPEHLTWNEKTQTGNPLVRNSTWLKKLLGKSKIDIIILEGGRVNEVGELGKLTSELTTGEAALMQFTSIMSGFIKEGTAKFPFLRAGDKALEKGFTFNEPINELKIQEANKIMRGYLADEMLSAYMLNKEGIGEDIKEYGYLKTPGDGKGRGSNLRVFEGSLNAKDQKEAERLMSSKKNRKDTIKLIDEFIEKDSVKSAIDTYLDSKIKDNIKILVDNRIISIEENEVINLGLPNDIVEQFTSNANNLSEGQLTSLMSQFTYHSLIANIEQTKLFTGDIAFFKDFFKRTSGLVGTGKTAWVGSTVDNLLNTLFPRKDKKSDSKIKSWIFNDVITKSELHQEYVNAYVEAGFTKEEALKILAPYLENNEADAQGYVTLEEYREFNFRMGDWNDERENVYQKALKGERLTKEDTLMLNPEKPQMFAPQEYDELYVPTFYKLSILPLIPSMIKGRTLEKLNNSMLNNAVGFAVFESGNKVGGRNIRPFYNAQGEFNESNTEESHILNYKYMKKQLDINSQVKNKVTFGSQFRKLILSGLKNSSITIKGKLTDGSKIIKEYNELINKQVELEFNALIKELGIERNGKEFVIKNPLILRDKLLRDSETREVADNLTESLDAMFKQGKIIPAELSVNRNKIEEILLGLVENRVIKQKMNGSLLVQAASTGFEIKPRRQEDISEEKWSSNLETLKFYTPTKGGTTPMEVYLPYRFKELLDGGLNNPELLDKRFRELIAFRTPTQGLNSIEAIKVKGFLPIEAGDLIIVPTEGVTKSGWDFDVDKLSVFFPNYVFDKATNKPVYVEYDENNPTLEGVQNRIIELSREILLAKENFVPLTTPNTTSALTELEKEIETLNSSLGKDENQRNQFVDWAYNLGIRETYLIGKSGVAQAALQNVNHVMAQIAGLKMKPTGLPIYLKHHGQSLGQKSWARTSDNNYEVSSVGDNRFSALNATLEDGRTIEEAYQLDVKGYRKEGVKNQSWKDGKGKKPLRKISKEQSWKEYKALWELWAEENPSLIQDLKNKSKGKTLTDKFAATDISQARALAEIIGTETNSGEIDLSQVKDVDNNRVSIQEVISQTLNGFVDIAADPFLKTLNISPQTSDVFFFLTRIGTPLRQTVLFLNQPIIREYLKGLETRSALYIDKENSISKKDLTEQILGSYPEVDIDESEWSNLMSEANLANNIKTGDKTYQRLMLSQFLDVQTKANKLTNLINAVTFDTSSNASIENARTKIENFVDILNKGEFINFDKLIKDTFLGAFAKATENSIGMYKEVFITESNEDLRNQLDSLKADVKEIKNKKIVDVEKFMSLAKNELISFLMQNGKLGKNKIGNYINDLFFDKETNIANNLVKIKTTELKDNYLIRELVPILSTKSRPKVLNTEDGNNIKMFTKRLVTEEQNLITEAWRELFEYPDAKVQTFAGQLMITALLQSGLNNSQLSFTQFIPNEYYLKVSTTLLNNVMGNNFKDSINEFKDKFYKNNYKNDNVVPNDKKSKIIKDGVLSRSTRPYIKKWDKSLKNFRLYRNTYEMQKNLNIFEEVNRLGDGYNFKEYANPVSVLEQNSTKNSNVKDIRSTEREEAIKQAPKKEKAGLIKSELIQQVKDRKYTSKKEKDYIERINKAKKAGEVSDIIKDLCN